MSPPPCRQLPACLAEDPLAQGDDQTGFLGHRDELARGDHPVLGVLPADQGLESLDGARLQRDDRLVVEQELPGFQCLAQAVLQFQLPLHAIAHRAVEYDRAAAPAELGLVHGGIGIAQYILGPFVAVFTGDDTDAGRADDLIGAKLVG